tara:strand:+ start:732 stop:851 length:120 start_codon:yes stop_codon:yes gene_type:complete
VIKKFAFSFNAYFFLKHKKFKGEKFPTFGGRDSEKKYAI